jgi:hypothetical protein
METTITVRPAAHDDIPDLAGVLWAFHDDAIWAVRESRVDCAQ